MKIFIDADAFIGARNSKDALHKKARNKFNELLKTESLSLFTSLDVVDEVATKLSYFLSKQAAEDFLDQIKSGEITVLFATSEQVAQAVKVFQSIPSKHVSFTDCMNMVFFQEQQIDKMFSFDTIYERQGIKMLE